MPHQFELTPQPIRARNLFLQLMVTTFLVEYVVMTLLPYVLPAGSSKSLEAIVDSCLLTLIVAPVVWHFAIRPIQRLSVSRMHFLRRSLTSQEEERKRITLELHDGVGQSLTTLLIGIRTLEEKTTDPDSRKLAETLRGMGGMIHEDLRRIIRGLQPAVLDRLGLAAALRRLIDEFPPTAELKLELAVSGLDNLRLVPEIEFAAFRIVQEALANAVRYSEARHITVSLETKDEWLEIRVADDGKGFDSAVIVDRPDGGYGLPSIRERAMILGGRVMIHSSPGHGAEIAATLPFLVRTNTP